MKKVFIVLTLLFSCSLNNGFCQKNYLIKYQQCVQIDTAKTLRDTIGWQATLIGNSNYSNYTWNKIYVSKVDTSMTVEQLFARKEAGTFLVRASSVPADSFGNQVFYNKMQDSLFLREKISEDYLITREKAPKIDWKILQEKMVIQGYSCTKAEAYFRGRNYTAWFTTEIPIVEGPWKFKGLPGLILKIDDDRGQVKIYATYIEYPAKAKPLPFEGAGVLVSQQIHMERWDKNAENRIRKMEVMNMSQEGFDKSGQTGKIKKKQGLYGIELKAD